MPRLAYRTASWNCSRFKKKGSSVLFYVLSFPFLFLMGKQARCVGNGPEKEAGQGRFTVLLRLQPLHIWSCVSSTPLFYMPGKINARCRDIYRRIWRKVPIPHLTCPKEQTPLGASPPPGWRKTCRSSLGSKPGKRKDRDFPCNNRKQFRNRINWRKYAEIDIFIRGASPAPPCFPPFPLPHPHFCHLPRSSPLPRIRMHEVLCLDFFPPIFLSDPGININQQQQTRRKKTSRNWRNGEYVLFLFGEESLFCSPGKEGTAASLLPGF